MNKRWFALLYVFFATSLPQCSVYQSEGRKFLEQHALEYQVNLLRINDSTCQRDRSPPAISTDSAAWTLLEERQNGNVAIFRLEDLHPAELNPIQIIVWSHRMPQGYCAVQYASASEFVAGLDQDVHETEIWLKQSH